MWLEIVRILMWFEIFIVLRGLDLVYPVGAYVLKVVRVLFNVAGDCFTWR